MYRESTGRMDVNISHNLSRKIYLRRENRMLSHINDLYQTSKIEMRYNYSKGV